MEASIKKIILATDFSDASKEASNYALLLTQTHNAELKALHVFDKTAWNIPSHDYLAIDEVVAGIEEARQRGKNTLKELVKSFGLKVRLSLLKATLAMRSFVLLKRKMLI